MSDLLGDVLWSASGLKRFPGRCGQSSARRSSDRRLIGPLHDLNEGEMIMSKGQRGNKEAKKPKKVQSPAKLSVSAGVAPMVASGTPDRLKKK